MFDNKMWVLGGQCGEWGPGRNDIWTSTDGITWTQVTSAAAWSPRLSHNAVLFKNKMWVLGGGKNDVWYSSDGKNWTSATSSAAWPARSGSQTVVYDNKLWIVGGETNSYKDLNDLWYSEDGATWKQATPAATWTPRYDLQALVYDNKLWIFGGRDADIKHYNDIWYYELPNIGIDKNDKPKASATGVTVDAIYTFVSGGSVSIRYMLNKPGSVGIGIYTCAGREIRQLRNDVQCRGVHTVAWDGCDAGGRRVGAGALFVRFRTGDGEVIQKIVTGN